MDISSRHCQSQTVRARELKFWENVHPPPLVTCHMSQVTCHMLNITFHISYISLFFFLFLAKWWSKWVEGLLSMGPTPYISYITTTENQYFVELSSIWFYEIFLEPSHAYLLLSSFWKSSSQSMKPHCIGLSASDPVLCLCNEGPCYRIILLYYRPCFILSAVQKAGIGIGLKSNLHWRNFQKGGTKCCKYFVSAFEYVSRSVSQSVREGYL